MLDEDLGWQHSLRNSRRYTNKALVYLINKIHSRLREFKENLVAGNYQVKLINMTER